MGKVGANSAGADAGRPRTCRATSAATATCAREDADAKIIRFEISSDFNSALAFDAKKDGDFEVDVGEGFVLVLDRSSAKRCQGVNIDFVEAKGGFKIHNPDEPPRVQLITAPELKAKFDAGDAINVFDVRSPDERARASIPNTTFLDDVGVQTLEALPKDTTIVFHCHHGGRSAQAAQHFLQQGWTSVYDLKGGIDAWAAEVDSSVPRY